MEKAILEAIIEQRDFEFLGTMRSALLRANWSILEFGKALKNAIPKRH